MLGSDVYGSPETMSLEAYACEAEKLVDMGDVLLVAGDPVECLGEENVEPSVPCIIEHSEHPGPAAHGGPGDRLVIVDLSYIPPFARRELPAFPDLIVDGFWALEVGRVSGVEGGFGHRGSGVLEPSASGSKQMAMEGVHAGSAGSSSTPEPSAALLGLLPYPLLRFATGCGLRDT
ncbi:hypothetical protein [Pseudogemmobacter humi]|uniref:hypothetical protein n=1 Tax=Pseudogemmobacter humi TaxID=2483812 RepID=UPI001F29EC93|nr:hypothetical protein [Pseudogemmobacter humi]